MKKYLFGIGVALALFITFLANFGGQRVAASNLTNDTIISMEQEIANTKKEKDQLQNTLTNVQNIKNELVNSKNDLAKYIKELDECLKIIERRIEELLILIAEKEVEITAKTAELDEARKIQRAQYEAMKIRIKYMYERGEAYFISMLFDAEDLSEMLNRADYIEMLSKYDRDKLEEYVTFSEYVALCKEDLENDKAYLDEAKKAVEAEKAAIEELIGEKTKQIEEVMGNIAQQEQAIREYEADLAAQDAVIKALEKAVAEERARLAAENARKYDGGKFSWPVPSSTRITDEYGNRIHPILGVPQFHNGIDIGAPSGDSIVAAYQGKVIAADYSPTMGNYLMIDHGDTVYTIYMHATKLLVGEGAEVSKGQKIATVGSTGRSTGPHLHFSVRVAGQYVSPLSYFGR